MFKNLTEHRKRGTLSLDDLVLNGDYKVLMFWGRSDGSNLAPNFNINMINDRAMLIKSIKLVPYAFTDSTDVFFDETNTVHYTVPAGGRLINLIDEYSTGSRINLVINGTQQPIFPTYLAVLGYPLDFFIDNIYYLYSEKINQFSISVNGVIIDDLDPLNVHTEAPNLKVFVECYLL